MHWRERGVEEDLELQPAMAGSTMNVVIEEGGANEEV